MDLEVTEMMELTNKVYLKIKKGEDMRLANISGYGAVEAKRPWRSLLSPNFLCLFMPHNFLC